MVNPAGDPLPYQPQNPQDKPALKKSHPITEKSKSILENLDLNAENRSPISKSGSISPPLQPRSPDLPARLPNEFASEKADLDGKTKGAWICVEKQVDAQSGGNIYTFRGVKNLTPEQENNLRSSIFPAVQHMPGEKARMPFLIPEPPEDIHFMEVDIVDDEWLSDTDDEEDDEEYYSSPTLQTLGYKIEVTEDNEYYLQLPDHRVLNYHWQQLQIKYPKLPSLEIISAQGAVDNQTFIQTFLDRKIILSSDEFVHDHLFHILIEIGRIFDGLEADGWGKITQSSYAKTMQAFRDSVEKLHSLIEQLERKCSEDSREILEGLRTLLSLFVDDTSALRHRASLDSVVQMLRNGFWLGNLQKQSLWIDFLNTRLGTPWKDGSISVVWNELLKVFSEPNYTINDTIRNLSGTKLLKQSEP